MKRNFVGQKVRRLRKERGMTPSELAGRIGIIQSDLCRREKGEYRVGLDTLFRILQVFGINIAEFFDQAAGVVRAAEEAELLEHYRQLTPASRSEVLDYVKFKERSEQVREAAAPAE